jgi:hypothetical protein
MVVGFERDWFKVWILPELRRLIKKDVIRVIDVLFVKRDPSGVVTNHELAEVLPEETRLVSNQDDIAAEWFTQDDIDAVADSLPDGSAVALILFEHRWVAGLDQAVQRANASMTDKHGMSRLPTSEIEAILAGRASTDAR